METETEQYLQRLFPRANVFRSLAYPDPAQDQKLIGLDFTTVSGAFFLMLDILRLLPRLYVRPEWHAPPGWRRAKDHRPRKHRGYSSSDCRPLPPHPSDRQSDPAAPAP